MIRNLQICLVGNFVIVRSQVRFCKLYTCPGMQKTFKKKSFNMILKLNNFKKECCVRLSQKYKNSLFLINNSLEKQKSLNRSKTRPRAIYFSFVHVTILYIFLFIPHANRIFRLKLTQVMFRIKFSTTYFVICFEIKN